MARNYVNATGVRHVRDTLIDFPRPDSMAADAIRRWATQHGNTIDPDRIDAVTLHYQNNDQGNWVGVVTQKMTLTQAVLANWQGESNNNVVGAAFGAPWAGNFPPEPIMLVDTLQTPGVFHYGTAYSLFNGLFRQTTPQRYSADTHVPIRAEDFQQFIWSLNFHAPYKAALDRYWETNLSAYRIATKIAFIAACNKQVSEGSLSDGGRRLAWQAAGLEKPLTTGSVKARPLNVYGYASTDLICMSNDINGLTLLYIPGNASPLHEFSSEGQMRDWFADQCRNPQKHAALLEHFALADRSNGLSYSGVDTALSGLASFPKPFFLSSNRPGFTTVGVWPAREYVNYKASEYSPWIDGDLFLALANRQKSRSYQDADFIITTDYDVTKAKWRGYVYSAMNVLAPLVLLAPELALVFAAGGVAQFGLGLDQAINSSNLEQKAAGVGEAVFGVLNALPVAVEAGVKTGSLYQTRSNLFVTPTEVNGELGYPLSPVRPPHWPDTEVVESFEFSKTIQPLPGADSAIANAVERLTNYRVFPDDLWAYVGDGRAEVVYDVERNAFILETARNEVDPVYYGAPQPGEMHLTPLRNANAEASDEARMQTLRALGIDLELPVDFTAHSGEPSNPIPKVVTHLWVGDKTINPDLVDNIARNAAHLEGSQYTYRLYLSNANQESYARNLQNLTERAPTLEVRTLEDQAFFKAFQDSEYFDQYQAAMNGNGGQATTYASAVDILRLRLLHHEGGLYMDVDDTLLATGEYPFQIDGQNFGSPGESIRETELRTTANGLLVGAPTFNDTLSMHSLYNTNMIGSHAGNPTLDMICAEIRRRFEQLPDFYRSKPDIQSDKAGFERFARQLNWLTGPGVFNYVVDRTLPELYRLRQTANLAACPAINKATIIDTQAYAEAERTYQPLGRIAKSGNNKSWVNV
jgi:hypothetical protein